MSKCPLTGFTLIEILVVVALLGVLAAISADTFTNIMRAQNKARVVNELQQTGNYVLSIIEQQVRDADEIWCCGSDDNWPGAESPRGNTCESLGFSADKAVGFVKDGEYIIFGTWNVVKVNPKGDYFTFEGITRRVNGGSTPILTDTDAVTGVDLAGSSFTCDAEGRRVTIELKLNPAPGAPTRKDFQMGVGGADAVVLKTTVVVRGSYE